MKSNLAIKPQDDLMEDFRGAVVDLPQLKKVEPQPEEQKKKQQQQQQRQHRCDQNIHQQRFSMQRQQ